MLPISEALDVNVKDKHMCVLNSQVDFYQIIVRCSLAFDLQ